MFQRLCVVSVSIVLVLGLTCPTAQAQKLFGNEAISGDLTSFTTLPGGACSAPEAERDSCTLSSSCSFISPPAPTVGTLLGDVATNRLTDTIWMTDGFTIHEVSGDRKCAAVNLDCGPLDSFRAPGSMGALTGMGMDSEGGTVTPLGTPALWVTDGALVAAIISAGGCAPPTVVAGPFPHGVTGSPAGTMTDVSWDPATGTLWLCDSFGFVHNIAIGGGSVLPSFLAIPGNCGTLAAPLQGLAVDSAWPGTGGLPAGTTAMYLTDGSTIDYITDTGAAAAPTFYTPTNCTTTNAPLNGLAYGAQGVNFGASFIDAEIDTYGQSTTPSSSFGLDMTAPSVGHLIWMSYSFDLPGAGPWCPVVLAQGTQWWVDPGLPGGLTPLGVTNGACQAFDIALPAGIPTSFGVFVQFLTTPPAGLGPRDSTGGVAFTIARP